jgi:poly-gamma-glutamate capsule biosynthesis protein CapA/YwtB (metallophosphatase superfamily)
MPFFFRGLAAAVEALNAMNISVVGLANNHALDFGEEALRDALDSLHAAGIATAGAGLGLNAARSAPLRSPSAALVRAADLVWD